MSNTDPGMDVSPPPGYQNPDPKMAVSPPPGFKNPDPRMDVAVADQPPAQQPPSRLWQPSPGANPAIALQPPTQLPAQPPEQSPPAKPRPFAFQRYTPAGPRPAGQRGKPGPFTHSMDTYPGLAMSTFMPHESESFGVIGGASRQLAVTAAPQIAGFSQIAAGLASTLGPFFDLLSNNAFSTAYRNRALGGIQQQEAQVRMQEAQMRMRQEEMEMKRQEFMENGARDIAAHSDLLTQYDTVLAQYNSGAITKEQAEDEIRQLNATHGHGYLDKTLEDKGIYAVDQYIQWEDQRMHDKWNAYASLYNADQARKKATGDQSDSWSKSGSSVGNSLLAPPQDETQANPQTGVEAGTAPTIDKLAAKYPDLSEEGVNAAKEFSETGKATGMTDASGNKLHPKAYHAVTDLSGSIDSSVTKILNSKEDREQKLKDIEGIDPNIAQKVRDIANYKELSTGIDNPQTRSKFISWAHQLNPKYDQNAAPELKKFFDVNGAENRALRAAANLPNIHVQTLRDLGGDKPIIMAKLQQAWNNVAGADPEYVLLANQLRQELVAINTIQNGTGGIRVTLLEEMMKTTTPTLPASTLRKVLNQDLAETWGRVSDVQGQFERFGRTEFAPGLTKHSWQMYSGALRTDEYGQVPSDAPPELKAVSRKGPAESLPPPTEEEARGAKALIARHGNDPNPSPELLKALHRARLLVSSSVSDAPWEHTPDDATDEE